MGHVDLLRWFRSPLRACKQGANDGIVSWQTALDYVAKLNAESHLGFQDWRLPNRNELMSLAQLNDKNSTATLQASEMQWRGTYLKLVSDVASRYFTIRQQRWIRRLRKSSGTVCLEIS